MAHPRLSLASRPLTLALVALDCRATRVGRAYRSHLVSRNPHVDLVRTHSREHARKLIARSSHAARRCAELFAQIFLPLGFASIEQDFRGTKLSGGKFDIWRECYNDTVDTIDWIVKQPWSNGVVHIMGASADGIAGLVLASDATIPQIESQFIIWATGAPYVSVFPGG